MTDPTIPNSPAPGSAATSSAASPPPGRYRIDPSRTTIDFTTRHMFGLLGVRGTFRLREGTIWVGASAAASRVEVVIDAASFNTNTPRREKDVLSARFLDATNHPGISFRSESISEGADGSWTVAGSATVKGVAAPVELHVDRLAVQGSDLTFHVSTQADRYAFNITAAKGMAGRTLLLDLSVVATADGP